MSRPEQGQANPMKDCVYYQRRRQAEEDGHRRRRTSVNMPFIISNIAAKAERTSTISCKLKTFK